MNNAFNLIRSAPIAFEIFAIRGSGILYVLFFCKTEVLRRVSSLVMCLKISEKPETFAEEAMIIPRNKGLPMRLWTGKFY